MIGVVDYGMGNLKSVCNAIDRVSAEVVLLQDPARIEDCSGLVLPGVGAFARAMTNLTALGFVGPMLEHVRKGKPFLGICLGMQLLSSVGYEHGTTEGLGLIDGEVVPLEPALGYRIPHVGWNNLDVSYAHPIFDGIKSGIDFYFVHSYHLRPRQPESIVARTDHGGHFVSAVAVQNVVGLQFHPEKSQEKGLRILHNFCAWSGVC